MYAGFLAIGHPDKEVFQPTTPGARLLAESTQERALTISAVMSRRCSRDEVFAARGFCTAIAGGDGTGILRWADR